MDWLLLCPMCACVVESFASLTNVGESYHCPMCRCDYESTLDEFIAVTFTVSHSVRSIVFHSRSNLSAVDYCFECRMTTDGLRPEGPSLAETLKALSQGVHYLPPNTVTIYNAAGEQGSYFGFDVDSRAHSNIALREHPLRSRRLCASGTPSKPVSPAKEPSLLVQSLSKWRTSPTGLDF
jgi:Family of unknown function (DUF5939)